MKFTEVCMQMEKRYWKKHWCEESPTGNFLELRQWPDVGQKVWYLSRWVEVKRIIKRERAVVIIDPEEKYDGGLCGVGVNWLTPKPFWLS